MLFNKLSPSNKVSLWKRTHRAKRHSVAPGEDQNFVSKPRSSWARLGKMTSSSAQPVSPDKTPVLRDVNHASTSSSALPRTPHPLRIAEIDRLEHLDKPLPELPPAAQATLMLPPPPAPATPPAFRRNSVDSPTSTPESPAPSADAEPVAWWDMLRTDSPMALTQDSEVHITRDESNPPLSLTSSSSGSEESLLPARMTLTEQLQERMTEMMPVAPHAENRKKYQARRIATWLHESALVFDGEARGFQVRSTQTVTPQLLERYGIRRVLPTLSAAQMEVICALLNEGHV